MLSTMAQVSAALVGLVLIAVFFFMGKMKDVFSSSDAEKKYISIGVLAGTPSKLVYIVVIGTIFVLLFGVATVVSAVDAMQGVGEVVDDELMASIDEVRLYFGIFLTLLTAEAFACVLIGGMVHLSEVQDFERLLGGPEAVKTAIAERNKEIERYLSEKKRSKGRRSEVESRPTSPVEGEDSEKKQE